MYHVLSSTTKFLTMFITKKNFNYSSAIPCQKYLLYKFSNTESEITGLKN